MVYGRASANAATNGWFNPTASSTASGAQPAAASARSVPAWRSQRPASSSTPNKDTP
jgi:hypothetical protein